MRIVFATDLSDANEAAIRSRTCLECLKRIGVTDVHLVTVVPDNVSTGLPGMDIASDRQTALRTQRETFESEGFDVETHVARGTPHRRINGFAERLHADMIVVGSRGQSPLENRLIGSTARNVARTAVRPLLIERIEKRDGTHAVAKEHLFQHVLFPTDFSENAARAFEFVPQLAGATQQADLLHVRGREERDTDVQQVRERLSELADDLETTMGIETGVNVRDGGVVDEILAEESRVGATVTVLGARGQSRLRRLLLGSVSESVIAQGHNNVLLIPPESATAR
ncbi:universal stress protein [Salinigranum marinum]|uniref:universal stress protein n=1 Tax=Salinigranum marinum TaxID=1515595 RepID=UPI002989AF6F|nr:universal stress protein [Salinigranum marinum]